MILDGAVIRYHNVGEPIPTRSIGVGLYLQPGLSADGKALSLTHRASGSRVRCSADFVATKGDEEISKWKDALGLSGDPARPLAGVTLVVEDASPDTCLTLIVFARRLAGAPAVSPAWLDYSANWEAGDIHITGEPERSWGALHSALVHPSLDIAHGHPDIATALGEGIAYLDHLLSLPGLDPGEIPETLTFGLHRLAKARLLAERQRYLRLRDAAPRFQLSVPLMKRGGGDSGGRRIVDAILLVETNPQGAVKAYLRRDAESFTGDGYALMAVHRPRHDGFSPDITISVDPNVGISLRALWQELERREDAAWALADADRPRDKPRPIVSFAGPPDTWPTSLTPSNQPWWDDEGRYTIIGAPRPLAEGVSGTRLGWVDVLDALGCVFAQGRDIMVRPRLGSPACEAHPLLHTGSAPHPLRSVLKGCSAKTSIDVVRNRATSEEPSAWTPTLERSVAAVLGPGPYDLIHLPEPHEVDVVHSRGGTVIVTADGVAIIEEIPGLGFPAATLAAAAEKAAEVLNAAEALEADLAEAETAVLMAVPARGSHEKKEALTRVYAIMLKARRGIAGDQERQSDPLVRRVAGLIEARWRAEKRFRDVAEAAGRLEAMVVSSNDVRGSELLDRVAIYGLPAAVLGNILGVAFSPLVQRAEGPWIYGGISWASIAVYMGLVMTFSLALLTLSRAIAGRWRRDIQNRIDRSGQMNEAPNSGKARLTI